MTNYKEIILQEPHTLIAGSTGSGKTVLLNNVLLEILTKYTPEQVELVLIDPKRIELKKYKNIPHTIAYASEKNDILYTLQFVINLMEQRYSEIEQGTSPDEYTQVFVIIDELADLMTTAKKDVMPMLQRLLQLARSSNIHLIACTQCPNRSIIAAPLTINFTAKIALHCDSGIESRQIIGSKGAEQLPRHGTALLKNSDGLQEFQVELTSEKRLLKVLEYWNNQEQTVKLIQPSERPKPRQKRQKNIVLVRWLKFAAVLVVMELIRNLPY